MSMNTLHDLELLLRSRIPLLVIESGEEKRALGLLKSACLNAQTMFFSWKITEGLQRVDSDLQPQRHNSEPDKVLAHIAAAKIRAVYALLDFHAHFDDPVLVRRLKDIVLAAQETGTTVVHFFRTKKNTFYSKKNVFSSTRWHNCRHFFPHLPPASPQLPPPPLHTRTRLPRSYSAS